MLKQSNATSLESGQRVTALAAQITGSEALTYNTEPRGLLSATTQLLTAALQAATLLTNDTELRSATPR